MSKTPNIISFNPNTLKGRPLLTFNGAPVSAFERGAGLDITTPNAAGGAQQVYERFTEIEAEVQEELYEPKDGLVLVPWKDDLKHGIKKIKWYESKSGGRAKPVEGADPEIARVSVGLEPREDDVTTFALGYEVDLDELAASPNGEGPGWDYVRACESACDEGLWEEIDRCLLGDGLPDFRGILGPKNGTLDDDYFVPGYGGGIHFRDASGAIAHLGGNSSAAALRTGMSGALSGLYTSTKKAIKPDTLAMSLRLREQLENKVVENTEVSVLEWIAKNSPYLESVDDIIGVDHFTDYYPAKGGNPAMDVVLPYKRHKNVLHARIMSPRKLKLIELPMGHFVIWIAKVTPVMWRRSIGGKIISTNYAVAA